MARCLSLGLGLLAICASGEEICSRDTGGTCRFFGCNDWRGPTNCKDAKCICKPEFCSYGGQCHSGGICSTTTSGTCSLFRCSSVRGDVDCVNARCVCKKDACSVNDVCYSKCPLDTGTRCHVFSCKDPNSYCTSGLFGSHQCLCKEGFCSVNGQCLSGKETTALLAANSTGVPQLQQPPEGLTVLMDRMADPAFMALSGLFVVPSAVLSFMLYVRRRQRGKDLVAPLLEDGEENDSPQQ